MNQLILIFLAKLITIKLSVLSQTIAVVHEKKINVWSISEMKTKNSHAHISSINCIDVFSSSHLVAGTKDNKILLYDFVKGILDRQFIDKNPITAIQKVNESFFVTGYQNGLTLWNFYTEEHYSKNSIFESINSIKVKSIDKKIFLSNEDGKIFILSSENLEILYQYSISGAQIKAVDFVDSNIIVFIKKSNNKLCKLDEVEIENLAADSNLIECVDENRNVNVIKVVGKNKFLYGIDHTGNTCDNFKIWEISKNTETIADSNKKNHKSVLSIEIINDSMVVTGDNSGNLYFFENNSQKEMVSLGSGKIGCIRILSRMEIEKIKSSNLELTTNKYQITSSKIEFLTTMNELQSKIQNLESTIITKYFDINSSIKTTTGQDIKNINTTTMFENNGKTHGIDESTKETHFINSIFTNLIKTSENDQWNDDLSFRPTSTRDENFSIETLTGDILNYSGKTTEKTEIKSLYPTQNLVIQTTFKDIKKYTIENASSLFEIETEQLMDIMTSKIDMVDCLTNCSGNGKCKLNNNEKFVCECDGHHIGPQCQIDSKPCASNPCLNGAECSNDFINKIYKCDCVTRNGSVLFYGANCEKKIDVCENETCSKNGVCNDVENEPQCKCFKSYSGEKCQVESQEMKTVKTVIKTSSIIAIIVLCATYLIFLIIDFTNFFAKRKKTAVNSTFLLYLI